MKWRVLGGLVLGAGAAFVTLTLHAASPQVPPPSGGPAPVYILLQATIDDVINRPASIDRLPRMLQMMQKLQTDAAAYHPVCLLQFNGVVADALAVENYGNHLVDNVKEQVRRGLVEVGYDGTEEPTFVARPRPNLRGADTPEKRWLARLQATQWFLTEWKNVLTGEPDPSKAGGLKRVLDVFGSVEFARGATFEPWYAGDLVHALEALGLQPALPGFLEPSAYPARNLNGYRGGAPMNGEALAADERSAPEVFWLDSALRLSDYGAVGAGVFDAYEGPEPLAKMIDGLDRSRLHVVQIRLGHPAVYVKPGFGARNYQTPLEFAYDNPRAPNVPAAALRSPEERAGMYAQEQAVLDWLVGTFFPANAGSRFVSVQQLRAQAESGLSEPVTRAELSEAAAALAKQTEAANGQLPPFVRAGTRYFSLADMFGLLTTALADAKTPGSWPASSQKVRLFGPMEIAEAKQGTGPRLSIPSLIRQCAALRDSLTPGAWTPVPRNAVPSYVTVDDVRLTAGQFLRAIAEAYAARPGTPDVAAKWTSGTSLFGERFPPTMAASDKGDVWTAKPASIRFRN